MSTKNLVITLIAILVVVLVSLAPAAVSANDYCDLNPGSPECQNAEEPTMTPPNPCDLDPTAPECVPTEEPIILPPVCTSDYCETRLFLPAILNGPEATIGAPIHTN